MLIINYGLYFYKKVVIILKYFLDGKIYLHDFVTNKTRFLIFY